MDKKTPDKPEFLCNSCKDLLCEDCASIAGEYEYLHKSRGMELAMVQMELQELRVELERVKLEAARWRECAGIGYPAAISAWMDDEMAKAMRAGRASMQKKLKESGLLAKLRKAEKAMKEAKEGRNGQKVD